MMHGSVRMARNVAEKQRRDRLNSFINDLANTVPLVASATRRLDKTSILRLSAAFLRLHDSPLNVVSYRQTAKDIVHGGCSDDENSTSLVSPIPSLLTSTSCFTGDQLNVLMDGLDGFVIVLNSDFKLIYVGPTCERFLGHQNIDMLGHQLSAFLHPGDIESVKQAVLDLKNQFLSSGQLESERIQVRCRMKERAQPRTEVVTYQVVKISGFFQLAACNASRQQEPKNNSSHNMSRVIPEAVDIDASASHHDKYPVANEMNASTFISVPSANASSVTDLHSSLESVTIATNGSHFDPNPSAYPPPAHHLTAQESDILDLDFQLSDFSPDSRSSFYPESSADCSSLDYSHLIPSHALPQSSSSPEPSSLSSSSPQLSQPSHHLTPLVNWNCCSSSSVPSHSYDHSNNSTSASLSPTSAVASSHASSPTLPQSSSSTYKGAKKRKVNHHHSVRSEEPLSSRFSQKFLSKNLLFKGFVEIIPASPMSELSLMDANQEEYVCRISLDGTLLYADHRISLVLGYTPDEVIGKSAYKFILGSDHVISLFAHKLMLSSSNGTGIVVHRLKTRSGAYVYLQSAGCLQYDRDTGKVDHFVNVARMLPESEGEQEMQKFIRKFAPHVASESPSNLYRSLQMAIAPKVASSPTPFASSTPHPAILPTQHQQQPELLQQQVEYQQHFEYQIMNPCQQQQCSKIQLL